MTLFRTVKYCFKAVSNINERPLSGQIVCPQCVLFRKMFYVTFFLVLEQITRGTRKVIFNQWPRPWCSYASDGHILECLGGEGRGTLSVWVEFQAPSLLNSGCLVLYDYNDFDFKTRFRHHLLVMITVVNCSFYVLINLSVDQDKFALNLEMYHKQVIFVREIFF